MATPVITFGDVVMRGANSYRWTIASGVFPHTALWLVTKNCAEDIRHQGLGKPLPLREDGKKPLFVKDLYAQEILPGPDPLHRIVKVQDKRWLWWYRWLSASFNMVRLSGEQIPFNDTKQPENRVSDPGFIFNKATLFPFGVTLGNTPWKASDILLYLIESDYPDGLKVPAHFKGGLDKAKLDAEAKDVQNLEIEDRGAHAIERVLGFMSGVNIFMDRLGDVAIYDTRSPLGDQIADETRLGHHDGGESLRVVRKATRPSAVVCLFNVKAEVKYEGVEGNETVARDTPVLVNVARVPDNELKILQPNGVQTVPRGSVVTLDSLLQGWKDSNLKGDAQIDLSLSLFCDNALKNHWGSIEMVYAYVAGVPNPILVDRVAEAEESWRSLWRLEPDWFCRIAAFEANRAGLRNVETAEPGPTHLWSAFVRRPNAVPPLDRIARMLLSVEGPAYSGDLADDVIAPANVVKIPGLSGVIKVTPKDSEYSVFEHTVFGSVLSDEDGGSLSFVTKINKPTADGLAEWNRTRNLAIAAWDGVRLSRDYRMATVLTCTPQTPQNINRFYAVEIKLDGDGPVLYERILGIEDARFVWKEEDGDKIIDAFRGGTPWSALKHLLNNPERVQAVAESKAKVIADAFRDRTLGAHRVAMNDQLEPNGSLAEVTHGLTEQRLVTDLVWPEEDDELEIWRFMDQSQRQAILRVIKDNPFP